MTYTAQILHVEADASLRILVRMTLEALGGYDVRSAAGGGEAVTLAGQAPPALVLLDLELPGIEGSMLLGALRLLPGLGDVPAVLLTAKPDPGSDAYLRELGVREVVRKPFRPHALLDAVNRVLGRA